MSATGIRSQSKPNDIMGEVYRAMMSLGYVSAHLKFIGILSHKLSVLITVKICVHIEKIINTPKNTVLVLYLNVFVRIIAGNYYN